MLMPFDSLAPLLAYLLCLLLALILSLLLFFDVLDIVECEENPSLCDQNALCNNFLGSFSCSCTSGYTGPGTTCRGKKRNMAANYADAPFLIDRFQFVSSNRAFYCPLSTTGN